MIIDKYLIISAVKGRYGGWNTKVDIRERAPTLKGNEISLRLKIDVPTALFERPQLEAVLAVPDSAVKEVKITPETTTNIEKIIREATGLTMRVSVVEQPETEAELEARKKGK